jgi:hypothetical protein
MLPRFAWAVLVVTAVVASGCGVLSAPFGTGGPPVIVLRDNANGKIVHVKAGDRIELILSSTYWDVAGSSAPRVVRQEGAARALPRPSGCPDIPGLGCAPEQADFSARAAGQAVIRASRLSCGEALLCPPDKRHFTVTLVVGAAA